MAFHNVRQDAPSWSNIEPTSENVEKLLLLCSNAKALRREGYVTVQLSKEALTSKLRCQNCGDKMRLPVIDSNEGLNNMASDPISSHIQRQANKGHRRDICQFHPGRVIRMHFSCCQAHVSIQKGCQINAAHVAPVEYMDLLERNWTFNFTPKSSSPPHLQTQLMGMRRGRARFANLTLNQPRIAFALDCEFGISLNNESELIRITAIDLFTKEVLIDSLVKPNIGIKNYVTRYSGVTSTDMRMAVKNNNCIFGRDAAREKLLEFVTSDTIIVLHGGSSDMSSLRLIHPKIIDTYVLETYFDAIPGGRSLKNLCQHKLNIKIQRGRGHDSLEDALACRELAVWMMNIIPTI